NGGKLTFRMILDRFSVEIFVNHGEQTISAAMFTDQAADGFRFFADGKVSMDVEKYTLDENSGKSDMGGSHESEI
ncbi:MAG: GH32 C-terminal domain-containing protein, partial [Oscillospiraceae bacterium]|nr:GH32 C-terminal domain-containing protein [Oscillospiraceae bacterium]